MGTGGKTHLLSVKISPELNSSLIDEAHKLSIDKSSLVRMKLNGHFNKTTQPTLQSTPSQNRLIPFLLTLIVLIMLGMIGLFYRSFIV